MTNPGGGEARRLKKRDCGRRLEMRGRSRDRLRPPREARAAVGVARGPSALIRSLEVSHRMIRSLAASLALAAFLAPTLLSGCARSASKAGASKSAAAADDARITLPAPVDPARFEQVVLLEGMDQPMEFELLPDGRVLFVERPGKVRVFDPREGKAKTVGELVVFQDMENGLLGSALDPDFRRNRWLYLFHSPVEPGADGRPCNLVSRFTLKGDRLELDLDSRVTILEIPTQRDQCCHQAGGLEFGPDGTLYISVGDNTNPFDSDGYSPSDYREGRSPWDAAKSSANTNDLRGKILRVRPLPQGGCEIPEGNLFPPGTPGTRPEIYVMGCRNPFRFSIDSRTGILYFGDVGPDAGDDSDRGPRGHDEINQARTAGNHGWPFLIADNQGYAAWDFAARKLGPKFDPAAPLNLSPNNTGLRELPASRAAMIWYPYKRSPVFPEVAEGGRTACAGPVYYRGDHPADSPLALPATFDHHLFIHEWERGWIKAVKLDENENVVEIRDFMPDHKFRRPVDMTFGPEGDLYLLEFGSTWGKNEDSRLSRLQYRAGNRTPVAAASADVSVGRHPLRVKFSSEGTSDKDGDPLKLRWRFDDGPLGWGLFPRTSNRPDPSATFRKPGEKRVRLRVTDIKGERDETELTILVGNSPPELRVEAPAESALFSLDRPIDYALRMRDAEDGDTRMLDMIQPEVFLEATYVTKRPGRAADGSWESAPEPEGLALMKKTNCFNCHAPDRRVVGPSFLEIADRYRTDRPAAEEVLIGRVIDGAVGQWGDEPMLPHKDHSREEVGKMVGWVLDRGAKGGRGEPIILPGVEGRIATPAPEGAPTDGMLLLTASYTDHGAPRATRLEARERVLLRGRRLGAEHADASHGVVTLDAEDGVGGKAIGTITEGDWIAYSGIDLGGVTEFVFRVASAGQGGWIEAREGSDGQGALLARAQVPVTGGWATWTEVGVGIHRDALEAGLADENLAILPGPRDVRFVFTNPDGGKEGLFNVDWIEARTAPEPAEGEDAADAEGP